MSQHTAPHIAALIESLPKGTRVEIHEAQIGVQPEQTATVVVLADEAVIPAGVNPMRAAAERILGPSHLPTSGPIRFNYTVDRIKRMDGLSTSAMEDALEEWVSMANAQHALLREYNQYVDIYTLEDVQRSENAALVLKQIKVRLEEFRDHFIRVAAADVIKARLASLKDQINDASKWLADIRLNSAK